MRSLLCFILLFTLSFSLPAQDSLGKPFFVKFYNADLFAGTILTGGSFLSFDEMKQAVPDAAMMHQDFTGWNDTSRIYYDRSLEINPAMGLRVGFVPYNKKKQRYSWHTTFHAGFFYSDNIDGTHFFDRQRITRYDTLQSSSGETYYLDSIENFNYIFDYHTQNFSLDLSQEFHTTDYKLFSAWIGYGVTFGLGIGNYYQGVYGHSKGTSLTTFSPDSVSYYTPDYTSDGYSEMRRVSNTFNLRLYIPAGFQFHFSKRNNAASHWAYFFEFKAGMDFQQVPNLGMISRGFFSPYAGFRYYFRRNYAVEV